MKWTVLSDNRSRSTFGRLQGKNERQRVGDDTPGISQSDVADCKLTYYSSECEVDFCGHGTIATMYSMIKDNPGLRAKPVVKVEINRKGIVEVFNAIETEDVVYITAPDPIEHPMNLTIVAIGKALGLNNGADAVTNMCYSISLLYRRRYIVKLS